MIELDAVLQQHILDDLKPNPKTTIECQTIGKIELEDIMMALVTDSNNSEDFPKGSIVLIPSQHITNISTDGKRIFIPIRRIIACTKNNGWDKKIG